MHHTSVYAQVGTKNMVLDVLSVGQQWVCLTNVEESWLRITESCHIAAAKKKSFFLVKTQMHWNRLRLKVCPIRRKLPQTIQLATPSLHTSLPLTQLVPQCPM